MNESLNRFRTTVQTAADRQDFAAAEADRLRRMERDRRATLRSQSLVPDRFAGARLAQLDRDVDNGAALDMAGAVAAQRYRPSLALFGGVGSGKTTIGAALVNGAVEAMIPARMISIVALFDRLHNASKYSSREDAFDLIDEFAHVAVLLLDDLGREPAINRQYISWLYELLNRRWSECRPLILTTNLRFEELAQRYCRWCERAGEPESTALAIVDRLRGLVPMASWVDVRGGSRRG